METVARSLSVDAVDAIDAKLRRARGLAAVLEFIAANHHKAETELSDAAWAGLRQMAEDLEASVVEANDYITAGNSMTRP
jgi:hypothetical protein